MYQQLTLAERFKAFVAGLFASGAEISAEDRAALEAAVKAAEDKPGQVASLPGATEQMAANAQAIAEAISKANAPLQEEMTKLRSELAQAKKDSQSAATTDTLFTLVRQMRITPAEAEEYKTLAVAKPEAVEAILPILAKRPPIRQVAGEVVKAKMAGDSAGAQLTKLAEERMKSRKEDFQTAFRSVCAEFPDLARAHAEDRPVYQGGEE